MTNAYELRTHFFLEDYNTAIIREDFETFRDTPRSFSILIGEQ